MMKNNVFILPAFIDTHCHLREPGFEYKEDIASATAAAYAGGYAAVTAMPNTRPVIDTPEAVADLLSRAEKAAHCKVYPTAAITVGQKGQELCDFDALAEAGAIAFTDDGHPVENAGIMAEAMRRCAKHGYLIMSHCEELSLAAGAMNEGVNSRALGLKGTPNAAEDVMIARDIILSEMTDCRLHIAHVSTKGGVELIRAAKSRGVKVTAETCPHYFTFTDADVGPIGVNAKMNPPLRSDEDRSAVIEGLRDGTLDCISTDHAPHAAFEKNVGLEKAPNGIIGLQTAFAAAYTFLVRPGHISLERLSELLTFSPARILGVSPPSDTVTADVSEPFMFSEDMILSKSKNSPFIGMTLYGKIGR